MNLLVSTNVYKPGQLARVIPHLHAFRGQIGVELFPMFDADCYEEELLHCLPEFEGIPVSFHGPYYETEHSAAPGTPEYAHSMDLIRQTLPYCVRLQSQYLVFHHNNIPVTEERREEMINYPFVISATKIDTDEAVQQTARYINDRCILSKAYGRMMPEINEKLENVKKRIKDIMMH